MTESIDEILENTFKKLGLSRKIKEKRVLDLWPKIIGNKIKCHTEAKYINQGVLFITVDSSTWAHQLLFMKNKFINKLNEQLKNEIIKDIRFKVGQVSNKKRKSKIDKNSDIKKIELNSSDIKQIKETSGLISDQDLQEKVYQTLVTDKKLRKWKEKNKWKPCSNCSTLVPPQEEQCSVCELKEKTVDLNKINKLLYTSPWLSYKNIHELFPNLLKEDFKIIKSEIKQNLKNQIDKLIPKSLKDEVNNQRVKVLIQNYVMLETEVAPENLTNELIKTIIGDNYMKVYRNL